MLGVSKIMSDKLKHVEKFKIFLLPLNMTEMD
jgi:hypothetical protein